MVSKHSAGGSLQTFDLTQPTALSKKVKSLTRLIHKNHSKRKMNLRSRRKIQRAEPDLKTTAAM